MDETKQFLSDCKLFNLVPLLQVAVAIAVAYLALKPHRYREEVDKICKEAENRITDLAEGNPVLRDLVLVKLGNNREKGFGVKFYYFFNPFKFFHTVDNCILVILTILSVGILSFITIDPSYTQQFSVKTKEVLVIRIVY
ncbi:MAG: hypothetical protein HQK99_15550 [Nitrospirae bacterium]|nr:hypothetical protein [Nitrospirota bacterium]